MILSGTESWNLPRLSGQKKHVESYSFRFADLSQQVALWYQQRILIRPGQEPTAAMTMFLHNLIDPRQSQCWKREVPLTAARIEPDIFYFAVGGGEFYHKGTHGHLETADSEVEWQLQWEPSDKSFRYLPGRVFYKTDWPLTKLVAPNPDITVSGWMRWGDQQLQFKQVRGHQTHSWGTHSPTQWCWAEAREFEANGYSSFEAFSASPFQLFRFVLADKEYRINRPWQWRRSVSVSHWDRWHFECQSWRTRFVGDVFVEPEHVIGLAYDEPDGSKRYVYHTESARLRLQRYRKHGKEWRLDRELKSLPSMAYAFGTSEAVPEVPLR